MRPDPILSKKRRIADIIQRSDGRRFFPSHEYPTSTNDFSISDTIRRLQACKVVVNGAILTCLTTWPTGWARKFSWPLRASVTRHIDHFGFKPKTPRIIFRHSVVYRWLTAIGMTFSKPHGAQRVVLYEYCSGSADAKHEV